MSNIYLLFFLNISKFVLLKGSPSVNFLHYIKENKCILNIHMWDDNCFLYNVIPVFYHVEKDNGKIEYYVRYIDNLDVSMLNFLAKIDAWLKKLSNQIIL